MKTNGSRLKPSRKYDEGDVLALSHLLLFCDGLDYNFYENSHSHTLVSEEKKNDSSSSVTPITKLDLSEGKIGSNG